ncbi:hypothetical protein VTK56DRAFT_5760 [Thermocarpiscus australiensis]
MMFPHHQHTALAPGTVATPITLDWFKAYRNYDEHVEFLQNLEATYTNNSQIILVGQSFEGRFLTGLHIWGPSGKGTKPAIVFYGNMHAREWITGMVVQYLAYNLLRSADTDDDVKFWLDRYEFYIFPVVNPDGFIYSWERPNTRLWRKTRQRQDEAGKKSKFASCVGIDMNRNFPAAWTKKMGKFLSPSSSKPCSEVYRGERPLSAPETYWLAHHLKGLKLNQGIKLFIDWHSWGQLIMYPPGHSCKEKARNHDELHALARGAAEAIKGVHGKTYKYGTPCEVLYPTPGSSEDYAHGTLGAQYAFAIELRDRGAKGFELPPGNILPNGEEAFEAVRYIANNMKHDDDDDGAVAESEKKTKRTAAGYENLKKKRGISEIGHHWLSDLFLL